VSICVAGGSPKPINQFAVVCYIPEKLGTFITSLRKELVCGCAAQSHVTILPPRPLSVDPDFAEADLRGRISDFRPFEIKIPEVRIFKQTSVIYAEVTQGSEELRYMHNVLNQGPLAFDEPYHYHPHITLAQNIDPASVNEIYQHAVRRWTEAPRHAALIESITFVQNTDNQVWLDLAEYDLREALACK